MDQQRMSEVKMMMTLTCQIQTVLYVNNFFNILLLLFNLCNTSKLIFHDTYLET